MTAITVVVADDHPVVRDGLSALLRSLDGIEVVGTAADGDQALREAVLHRPDVLVMDVAMPGTDGVTATRHVAAAAPATAVLMLTMFDDDDSVLAAMQAGARGYLLKGARQTRSSEPSGPWLPARRSSGPASPAGCSASSAARRQPRDRPSRSRR